MGTYRTIVLVDDQVVTLRYMRDLLNISGFDNVVIYEDPLLALADIEQNKVKPDLLIADYRMPEMNGKELLDKAKTLIPDVQTIIITACASDVESCEYRIVEKDLSSVEHFINEISK